MLGKGLESLIPAGGYKKSDDSSLQSYGEPNQQPQSSQPLSAYTELPVQNNTNYSGIITNDGAGGSLQDIDMSPISPLPQIAITPIIQPVQPVISQPQVIESLEAIAQEQFISVPQTTQVPIIARVPEIAQAFQTTPVSQDIPSLQNTPVLQPMTSSQPIISPQAISPQINPPRIDPLQTEPVLSSAPAESIISVPQTTSGPIRNFADNNLSLNPVLREETEEDYSRKQSSVFQIEVEKIFPNPHQPRRHFDENALIELANSIREFGIIQPLIATKILKETESGTEVTYQLIAGERRLMAAKKVGLRTVPVVIKQVGMDRERLELAIIENVQREDLSPLEAARGYAKLQDEFRLTQREIATRIGKSRETVANTLRLLHLPSEIQQALEQGIINESHARLLLQIDDISRQKDMFQSILRLKPSVRDLKAIIRRAKTNPSANYLSPELISLQSRLEEFLGTKAQIDDDGGKGKITINYYSSEELNALIHRLSGADF